MKLARVAILLLLLAPALRAETTAAATAWKPTPLPRWRKAAIGLLVGGGACLALGAVFAGLASQANNDALAGMKYHPEAEDRRTDYMFAGGAFFVAGGAAVISGAVLLW